MSKVRLKINTSAPTQLVQLIMPSHLEFEALWNHAVNHILRHRQIYEMPAHVVMKLEFDYSKLRLSERASLGQCSTVTVSNKHSGLVILDLAAWESSSELGANISRFYLVSRLRVARA